MPKERGGQGYIFNFMCPGGEAEEVVYNQVSEVFIFFNNTVPKSYNEICLVKIDHFIICII